MEDRKYHIDLTNDEVMRIVFALDARTEFWRCAEDDGEVRVCQIIYKEYKLLGERMRKLLIIGANNE